MFKDALNFSMTISTFENIYMPILEALTDPFIIIEFALPSKIVLSNKLAEQLFLYDKAELKMRNTLDLFSDSSVHKYLKNRELYEQDPNITPLRFKGVNHDYYGKKKNGEEFPLDRSISPIMVNGEMYVLVGCRDLTELKKYEKDLQDITAELSSQQDIVECEKQNIQYQEDFVDTLCHELRNPLNGLYHGIQMLQDAVRLMQQGAINTLEQNKLLADMLNTIDMVNKCIQQQQVIVDSVLTFSKLENSKIQLNIVAFDLTEVINNVAEMFLVQIEHKKIELKFEIAKESLWLKGDPTQLSQVLINLISNAIKFTEYGSIVVSFTIDMDHVLQETDNIIVNFIIKDTGVGMLPDELNNIFKRFGQANVSTGKDYGGSGLGLVISKKIIELMGGTIRVESRKWEGTTFCFSIHCKYLTDQEQLEAIRKKNLQSCLSKIIIPQLNGKKVLIVEDNIINMKVLCNLLEPTKCVFHKAFDGESALEQFAEHRFDIIFMDIGLPKMTGLEVTRKIREKELLLGYRTPIICLSGFARKDTRRQALHQNGMDEYLTKPYEKHKIFEMISKYILVQSIESHLNISSENISTRELSDSPTKLLTSYKRQKEEHVINQLDHDVLSEDHVKQVNHTKCLIL